MGRVRRYKKLKACDPCASGRGAAQREEDAKYDMAPSGLDSDEERCTYGVRDGDREGRDRKGRRRRGWMVGCMAGSRELSLTILPQHSSHDLLSSTINQHHHSSTHEQQHLQHMPSILPPFPLLSFPHVSHFLHPIYTHTQATSPPSPYLPTHPPSPLNNKTHSRWDGRRPKEAPTRAAVGKRRLAGQRVHRGAREPGLEEAEEATARGHHPAQAAE